MAAAEKAQPAWEALPATQRSGLLRKFAALVRANGKKIADLEARSMGKPVGQPFDGEISASTIEHNAVSLQRF